MKQKIISLIKESFGCAVNLEANVSNPRYDICFLGLIISLIFFAVEWPHKSKFRRQSVHDGVSMVPAHSDPFMTLADT